MTSFIAALSNFGRMDWFVKKQLQDIYTEYIPQLFGCEECFHLLIITQARINLQARLEKKVNISSFLGNREGDNAFSVLKAVSDKTDAPIVTEKKKTIRRDGEI